MSDFNPVFSIIVPTRNRTDWLRRCLEGINEQIYSEYEVLIVDDGSNEAVLQSNAQMIKKEFGSKFRLIKANGEEARRLGPSVVRNIGINESRGQYIAFCDDDDYWCASDLLSVAAAALEKEGAELYFSNQKILHGDQVVSEGSFSNVEATTCKEQLLQGLPVYKISPGQMLCFPDYAHLNITIAKKTLLEGIGGFWEETRYAEDVDLFVRLCDSVDSVLFRPDVCSTHNAPIKHDKESASKIVGDVNRRLLESSVYWHLLAVCKSPEAIRYAALSLSSNSKHLTIDLKGRSSPQAAAIIARLAFGARPTLKWGLYAAWISLKAKFVR